MRRLVILLPLLLSGCGPAYIPLYIAALTFGGIVANDATQIYLRNDVPKPAMPATKP